MSLSRQSCQALLNAIQKVSTTNKAATTSGVSVLLRQYHALPAAVASTASGSLFPNTRATNTTMIYSSNKNNVRFVTGFGDNSDDGGDDDNSSNDDTTIDTDTPSGGEKELTKEEELQAQVTQLKDQLLRSLAEQENIRRIAKKDVENARNFAVTSFAKSLLDTSDNLTRAMDAVPIEFRTTTTNTDGSGEQHQVLATLYQGIEMTDAGLTKAFEKNGLKSFGVVGDKFDPNLHEALFEYPRSDPEKEPEPGCIGQVMKSGFMLKERVIRPAEVGVIKK